MHALRSGSHTSTYPFFDHHRLGKHDGAKNPTLIEPSLAEDDSPVSISEAFASSQPPLARSQWLPSASEFGASVATGALGGLVAAPLWMRQRLNRIENLSLTDEVEEILGDDVIQDPKKAGYKFVNYISNPESLMMMIPFVEPRLTLPALGVSLMLGIGYLGTNVLSGMQEVWVRFQESLIRASLVSSLDGAYQDSIAKKTQVDEINQDYAHEQIEAMLLKEGVENPSVYINPVWKDAPDTLKDREAALQKKKTHFVIFPQNRNPLPRASMSDVPPPIPASKKEGDKKDSYLQPIAHPYESPLSFMGTSRMTIDSIGATLGFSLSSIMLYAGKAVHEYTNGIAKQRHLESNMPDSLELIKTTLAPKDVEGVLLHFFSSRKGIAMGGLFVTLGVMLRTTQFLVEGLREIEVTRLNADTEKQYETYKFTTLEPHFKAVSERSQLNHALKQLQHDLPELKNSPNVLHSRIQRILDDIGLTWSAPNYYPMSPIVQLVPARS